MGPLVSQLSYIYQPRTEMVITLNTKSNSLIQSSDLCYWVMYSIPDHWYFVQAMMMIQNGQWARCLWQANPEHWNPVWHVTRPIKVTWVQSGVTPTTAMVWCRPALHSTSSVRGSSYITLKCRLQYNTLMKHQNNNTVFLRKYTWNVLIRPVLCHLITVSTKKKETK